MRNESAEQFSVKEEFLSFASTGIIGLDIPMDKISSHIPKLYLGDTTTHAYSFNEAILTTDTFKKATCFEATIGGKTITMGASTKGSGMIEPNMEIGRAHV